MNFDLVAWVAALVLALVFAVAGAAKLRDPEGTRAAIAAFGLPEWATRPGAMVLPITELAIAVSFVFPPTSLVGAVGASILLAAFIAGISWNLARGRSPECHCFGQLRSTPVGARTIFRNLVLLGMASLPSINGGASPTEAFGATLSQIESVTLTIALVGLGATTILGSLVVQLSAEIRDLRDRADRTVEPSLLPFGSPAPAFVLESAHGGKVALGGLTARDVPTLLVFVSASCGPCKELMPEIARWQAGYSHVVTVAVVASGDRAGSIEKAAEHGLADVLLDEDGSVSDSFGADATPSAILLNEDGNVDTEMVAGPDRIRQVVETMVAARAHALWQEATGERLGAGFTSDAGTRASGSAAGT